ncbi:acyl-CoA dehydrogenase family protein [Roseicyclus amphidinii]|uniref:acyl-CoA dehydrogenase family protein n=1 Tax=Roseicyclus amphidinii TaxID=3034232 RepID=UPI0024E12599|nr:acyl-CoA dehydrogenase family protein [Roseicyclus sp. Amp-Y-6]
MSLDLAIADPTHALGLPEPASVLDAADRIAAADLVPLVRAIDVDGLYPEEVMRSFGAAGAFQRHLPAPGGALDLDTTIAAMARAGQECLSTAFCMWCQSALGWYIYNSDNTALQADLGAKVATGEILGGTGLSNPMKTLFGIETMKLKATRVEGGYTLRGTLPWVSNINPDAWFAVVSEIPEGPRAGERVMMVIHGSGEGVKLVANDHFVALEGTRTYGVQCRDAFVPDAQVLADPINAYIPKIRAGFILLQSGMAFGMIEGCIALMEQVRGQLGHVNRHLPDQPEHFREKLEAMKAEVAELTKTPYDTSQEYFIRVVRARLAAGDLSVAAAHNAMLHQGARGYVTHGAAQRKLRESYFVAIVTPATKQLRKMLADMGAEA